MKKKNCWEFKQCGRGPDGKNDCPAAQESALHGVHGGVNAGRACWVVAGTSSESGPSGTFAKQLKECLRCDFFRAVQTDEQGSESGFSATMLGMLKTLQGRKSVQNPPASPGIGQIDLHLQSEFAQEVNRLMSAEHDANAELKEEFAKEVERLSSQTGRKGT